MVINTGVNLIKTYNSSKRLLFSCTTLKIFLVSLVVAFISACGGDGGTLLGGGQNPDPTVQDFALAYVKRPLVVDDNGELVSFDVTEITSFLPGAELWMRDRASAS
ncbi:MAG: hypothetical protein KUG75_06360, partial [Pseudomonadales bacterium]|nr:hypothetical protein [Pseudomonadales bacterium]